MDVWRVRGAGYAAGVLVVSVLWEREGDVVDVRAWRGDGGWRSLESRCAIDHQHRYRYSYGEPVSLD